MKRMVLVVAVMALALGAAACGDNSTEGGDGSSGTIALSDAWAWSSMPERGAAYVTIENTGEVDDRLTAVSADVDGTVELHETKMVEGQAEMTPVEGGLTIPAGGTVMLEPGGYHVMFVDLTTPLEVGDTVSITFTFEDAGELSVDAEVKPFVEEEMGGSMESPSEEGM